MITISILTSFAFIVGLFISICFAVYGVRRACKRYTQYNTHLDFFSFFIAISLILSILSFTGNSVGQFPQVVESFSNNTRGVQPNAVIVINTQILKDALNQGIVQTFTYEPSASSPFDADNAVQISLESKGNSLVPYTKASTKVTLHSYPTDPADITISAQDQKIQMNNGNFSILNTIARK